MGDQRHRGHRKTQPIHGGLQHKVQVVKLQAAGGLQRGRVHLLLPAFPVLAARFGQQQHMGRQRLGPCHRALGEQGGRAHHQRLVLQKRLHLHARRPPARAAPQGQVEGFGGMVRRQGAGDDLGFDVRVLGHKAGQPGDQPAHRKAGPHIDLDAAQPGVAPQRLGGGADLRERRADLRVKLVARCGEQHLPRLALEQVHAQVGLQRLDLAADGAVGDMQLQRCVGKALVPRRRHKGTDRVQRGQAGWHAGDFHMRGWALCGCCRSDAGCQSALWPRRIKVSQPGAH